MSAISASEKVDGFTRKSMRKAQKQRKSQGSSQYRTQSAPVELSPLPQLKGTVRGWRGLHLKIGCYDQCVMCTSRCAAVSFSMPVSRICSKYFAHFACSTVHKYVETCRTGKHKELWTHLQTFPPQLFAAFPLHKQLRRVYHRPNIKWLSVKVHHISFVLLVQNATVLFAFLASGLLRLLPSYKVLFFFYRDP